MLPLGRSWLGTWPLVQPLVAVVEQACGVCVVCKYVRTVCVTVVVCVWCTGLLLRLCVGDREGTDSLSWISLVMSCTACVIKELSLSLSLLISLGPAPFPPPSPSPFSTSFSFLQAAGFGEQLFLSLKEGSAVGVPCHSQPPDSQGGVSASLVLPAVTLSWLPAHVTLGELSELKRPSGSGGAVGSQKLSLCAIRAITSCLSCSSEPIRGLVSVAAGLGGAQRAGSVREIFLKALRGSAMGPFDLSVPLVPQP